MKKRRLISFLIITVLILGTAAACGPPAASDSPPPENAAADDTAETGTAAPVAEDGAETDSSDVTIKVVTLENECPDNELVEAAINEALGFTVEWIPLNTTYTVANAFATDPTIDVLLLEGTDIGNFIAQGYLLDLNSYMGDERFPNIQEWCEPFLTYTSDGKLYSLPIIGGGRYAGTNGNGWAFREDWLKAAGLDYPKTVEEFEAVLAAFKELYPDKYPLWENYSSNTSNSTTSLGTIGALLARSYSKAGLSWWVDENGYMRHWLHSEGIKDFVQKLSEWYELGYLHPEFITADAQTSLQLMSAGEVGVVAAWCTNPINPNVALKEENPEQYFRLIPGTFEGPAGKGIIGNPMFGGGFAVNAGTEHADECMRLFEYFTSLEGAVTGRWGVEGVNWTRNGDGSATLVSEGEHAYTVQYGQFSNQIVFLNEILTISPTGDHYTDAQYANWFKIFYSDERKDVMYYDPDCGYVYDYSTGENQYFDLLNTSNTYIDEWMISLITGTDTFDNWDNRLAELQAIALDQMEKERNEQWAKYGNKVYEPQGFAIDPAEIGDWMVDYDW